MKSLRYILTTLVIITIALLSFNTKVNASNDHDLQQSSNYNLTFLGPSGGDFTDEYASAMVDINDDGIEDYVFGAWSADFNGIDSGSVFAYDGNLFNNIQGNGNLIDTLTNNDYLFRIDGRATYEEFGEGLTHGDFDGDGMSDLAIGSWGDNNGGDSGSLYVILGTRLRTLSGNYNTANNEVYDLRIDGASAGNIFSYTGIVSADFDQDGKDDLVVSAGYAMSSIYYFKGSLITSHIENSKTTNVGLSSTYTARYYGSETRMGMYINATGLIGSDNIPDLMVPYSRYDANGLVDSGSLFVIDGTKLAGISGTNNDILISVNTNYTLRIDGAVASERLADWFGVMNIGDLDNNGKNDIIVSTRNGSSLGRSRNGKTYIIFDSTFNDLYENALQSNIGNNILMSNSDNYDLLIHGSGTDSFLSVSYNDIGDFNSNGTVDLLLYNALGLSIIDGNNILEASQTTKSIDMSDTGLFVTRYYDTSGFPCGRVRCFLRDLNLDGSLDLIMSDTLADEPSRTNAGQIYIIYNYPHTITLNPVQQILTTTNIIITGTVTAPNSVTQISGVEYRVDNNDPSGTWTPCTATDGTFDSLSEEYSCNVSGLGEGEHTVYIRSYDENTSYTAQSKYKTVNITVDLTLPTGSISINNGKGSTNNTEVELNISATDNISGVVQMMISSNADFNSAEWEAYSSTKAWSISSGDGEKVVYIKFKDGAGNISSVYSDGILMDTVKPELKPLKLNKIDMKDSYTNYYWTSGKNLTISGEAENGSSVEVRVILEDGVTVYTCSTTAKEDNTFSCTFSEVLPSGYHKVVISATDEAGNTTQYKEVVLGISVGLATDTGSPAIVFVILGILVLGVTSVWYRKFKYIKN